MIGRFGSARLWRRLRERWAAWRAHRAGAKRRLRLWLVQRFLPMWAKETILAENERLYAQLAQSRAECERLRAYAGGLEAGLAAVRGMKITVTATGREGASDEHHPGTVG